MSSGYRRKTYPGEKSTLDGYAAYQLSGIIVRADGQVLTAVQKTVVIPAALSAGIPFDQVTALIATSKLVHRMRPRSGALMVG